MSSMVNPPTFNAIDVETANSDRATICQIGIAHVIDGELVDAWQTLVDPEDWFDPVNIGIHGIDESSVAGSPTMPEIRDELRRRLRGSVLISHMSFDRIAFERAMNRYGLEQLQVTWLDSARIARLTWEKYRQKGYSLKNIAKDFNIEYTPHDALEDAETAAKIVIKACGQLGVGIDWWVERINEYSRYRGVSRRSAKREVITYDDNELDGEISGDLKGKTLLFTGELKIRRAEATELAMEAGAIVSESISRKVDVLVVGTQDRQRLRGHNKSAKHRKAEALISEGCDIQIVSEDDFMELLKFDNPGSQSARG